MPETQAGLLECMEDQQVTIDSNLQDANPRVHRKLIIVMEKLSELSNEISKELRGKDDKYIILEELADVQLGIYYVQEICGIHYDDLHMAINVKRRRPEHVLGKKEKEQ